MKMARNLKSPPRVAQVTWWPRPSSTTFAWTLWNLKSLWTTKWITVIAPLNLDTKDDFQKSWIILLSMTLNASRNSPYFDYKDPPRALHQFRVLAELQCTSCAQRHCYSFTEEMFNRLSDNSGNEHSYAQLPSPIPRLPRGFKLAKCARLKWAFS